MKHGRTDSRVPACQRSSLSARRGPGQPGTPKTREHRGALDGRTEEQTILQILALGVSAECGLKADPRAKRKNPDLRTASLF